MLWRKTSIYKSKFTSTPWPVYFRLGHFLFMLSSFQELQEEKITILDLMYSFYTQGETDSSLRTIFWINCSYGFILSLKDKRRIKITRWLNPTCHHMYHNQQSAISTAHFWSVWERSIWPAISFWNGALFLFERFVSSMQVSRALVSHHRD